MQPIHILLIIAAYFGVLILVSLFTGKGDSNADFFQASRQSPWYLVAFGMIGASLSGVTFISVPGWVEESKFSYFQVVLGYIVGYFVIGSVLLPLYYRLNLTSIYTYLEGRFGRSSYKTGASFFLLSRMVGSAFRLYLIAVVLQALVFDDLNIPFWATVTMTILLIWVYTFKNGIKTVVLTDTLQTFFMLLAVGITVYFVADDLGLGGTALIDFIAQSEYSQIFFFDDWRGSEHFVKQFISGAFIAIVMTGLDQDMMQKNLTCRTLGDAQKNMFWFTIILTIVNFVFLVLGLLLTVYAQQNGIDAHRDQLYPTLAMQNEFGILVAVLFIIGLVAAAYSSADSALTALTTSFCIDILEIEKRYDKKDQVRVRKRTHVLMSISLIAVIIIFKYLIADESVIAKLFVFAGYTYGPLLGLYSFGLFTKWKVRDRFVPVIAIATPFIGYFISEMALKYLNFEFGFFILILNGALTYLGLVLLRRK
ncbi:MAG: sodium:solute symporter [Bacteroidetes bacterium]|jgi:Na+/proline symporter|nr:sodium:solute symporter [Bacteroidota bacterium]